jgi:hypothetical protein
VAYQTVIAFEADPGLTLQAVVKDADGDPVGSAVTTGFTEEGDGWYWWAGSLPDGHLGVVVMEESGGAVHHVEAVVPARVDLDQAVPFEDISDKTTQTVGDCLSAARAHAAGKMVIASTVQTYYGPDGTTVVRQFDLNSAVWPSQRT